MLPMDDRYTRCLGRHGGHECGRMDTCARYRAVYEDPPGLDAPMASRLCYSEFPFYMEAPHDARNP